MQTTLSSPFAEWAGVYRPIPNPVFPRLEYGGCYFGLTREEVDEARKAANPWTLVLQDGDLRINRGFSRENALGYFITRAAETSHSGLFIVLGRPNEVTPAREALALSIARMAIAADCGEEHERDFGRLEPGMITGEGFALCETTRFRMSATVKVFFNPMAGAYAVEEKRFEDLVCGRCGQDHPGDPCHGCGDVQPLSDSDYYRANLRILELPPPVEPVESALEDLSDLPF